MFSIHRWFNWLLFLLIRNRSSYLLKINFLVLNISPIIKTKKRRKRDSRVGQQQIDLRFKAILARGEKTWFFCSILLSMKERKRRKRRRIVLHAKVCLDFSKEKIGTQSRSVCVCVCVYVRVCAWTCLYVYGRGS